MPAVFNKRSPNIPPGAVYVGRPTKWGNPFSHRSHGTLAEFIVPTRDEAVDSYRKWLLAQPDLVSLARSQLAGKDLVCWCAPARCHADVLLDVANNPQYETRQDIAPPQDQSRGQQDNQCPPNSGFTGRFRRTLR